jgi:hypothetical protein
LHLGVAQSIEGAEVLFEGALDFPDLRGGQEPVEQLDRGNQAPGPNPGIVDGLLRELFLATLELFSITLPLLLERLF